LDAAQAATAIRCQCIAWFRQADKELNEYDEAASGIQEAKRV
jgi:hypothetical protein